MKEQFIKYHWKQTIVLAVVVILVVAWNVVLEDTDWLKRNNGQVMGAAAVNLDANNKNLDENILLYQNKIKNLVSDHLVKRSKFDKPHQDWLFLINKTKYQALSISVPDEYKDLHIKLISILDLEKNAVAESDQTQINQANQRWADFLKQYFWLN